MYGKSLGVVNAATGISLLPDTGNNHVLFALAIGLVASGVLVFVVSTILGRKTRQNEA